MTDTPSGEEKKTTLTVPSKRTIFFISDRTAITAITLGQSLLTQFDHIEFDETTLPFIDTVEKAQMAVEQVNEAAKAEDLRPIVFSTLINPQLRKMISSSNCVLLDFFDTFISNLETELSTSSSQTIGRYHGISYKGTYDVRIEAVNYAINNDDGISTKNYDKADVILTGVSRTGKTPTCLYLGLQFGIFAANYPLTDETINPENPRLPESLKPFRNKLYGLNINPERLHVIRSQRRPDSNYASVKKCRQEVSVAHSLFTRENFPFLNVTAMSVEEIASTILHESHLKRRYS